MSVDMDFTYDSYRRLVQLLGQKHYKFVRYDDCHDNGKIVIMRHDVDNSLDKALELAEIENSEGITSTYFILLSTDFYNIASKQSLRKINKITDLGHDIGLHFDEVKYENSGTNLVEAIKKEFEIMQNITGIPMNAVSMHRPSKQTLEADYRIDGIINSYSKEFFVEFKYLSDSRRRWRENVCEIIEKEQFNRLHILTHPFWYNEESKSITESVEEFISDGNKVRYTSMKENITDLESILAGETKYGKNK